MAAAERLLGRALGACLLLSLASARALTLAPVEFAQAASAVAPALTEDRSGGFVLTYTERHADHDELRFLRLDAEAAILDRGRIAASEPAQPWFVNWADFPSLAVLDNGDWVSFYLRKSSTKTYAYDIWLTRSRDQGRNWDQGLRLHRDGTQSEHGFVSLLPAGRDRVLAMWLDGRHSVATEPAAAASPGEDPELSAAMSLRSAVVDGRGRISAEAEIDRATCDCCGTDAVRFGKDAWVLYRDRSATEIRDIYFSRGQADGHWTRPQPVHGDRWRMPACPVNGPALASNRDALLALWSTMPDGPMRVRAALGDRAGFGPMQEIEVGERVLGRVDAKAFGTSGFVITWLGVAADQPEQSALKLARFDAEHGVQEVTTVTVLPPGRSIGFPRLASQGEVGFIAWTEPGKSGNRIRLMRISP